MTSSIQKSSCLLSTILSRTIKLELNEKEGYSSESSGGISPLPFEDSVCAVCGYEIKDQYVLKVMSASYHERCLRCVACNQDLASSATCYVKDGRLYCREDHSLLFSRICGRCRGPLRQIDMVFRCLHATYHQPCFTCYYCHMQFKKGDEYLIVDGEIVCRKDYQLWLQSHMHSMAPGSYDFEQSESSRKTPKRPRTILNAQQRRQFKLAFDKSAKPCRKIREQLAKETGLSVRVVQVWFQNQRAKMKKMQRKEDGKRGSSTADSEGKSVEEGKSSDEDESDCDDLDAENNNGVKVEELTDLANPIDKLYHMQSTYFQFT